ncbi:uncharacterized protein LOC119077344 [Bradysia coprophila]|uniref:uncharacterized protein LOC119077344 n=1 Tax=Bradysia coprophila TaxID=38358 RepID=UPI00187D8F0C|nr:uncharacterized protein LOC119077344 [Bradysia coprophila]XP_037040426.1 uncharacterized protein LOC119077344 [Bradysia coprophila]
MICSDSWKLLHIIVAMVVTLISFRPVSAAYGEIFSGTFHACRYSACDHHPICPYGHDSLTQTRDGCSDSKQKNYCCPSGTGPQCFFTACDGDKACPENYRELDRTRVGCSEAKVYCCKKAHLPYCFDMTCPTSSESEKSCPPEYRETRREIGQKPGCDSTVSMRLTCCLHDNDDDNGGGHNQNDIGNTKNEDGGIRIFTNYKRGMYSSGETAFAVFLKVLILLPIIIAML